MPFQGNPNAGQPDPALLNLLFQQKAQREERAYKMQQDALAAQRQAQLDAAEEARKDAEHKMKLAKDAFEIMNKAGQQEEAIGATQANNRQAKEAFAQAFPFISTPGTAVQGPSGSPAVEYGALPDQSVQNAYEQQQFGQQLDGPLNARIAALASVLNGISPEMQQYAESLPGQGIHTELTRGRLADEAAAKSQAEFDRQAKKEADQATTAYDRSKRLKIDQTDARNQEIIRLDAIAKNPKTAPQDRALASMNRDELIKQKEHEMLASIPGEAVTDSRDRRIALNDYNTRFRVVKAQEGLLKFSQLTGGRNLGVQADVTKLLANFRGIIEDATKLPFVDAYANSVKQAIRDTEDPAIRQRLQDEFLSQSVLDRISQGNITQQDATWLIARTNNPSGRITNAMLNNFENPSKFMGFISSELSESQLRRNISTSRSGLADLRNEIEQAWPGRLKFDPQTGEWLPTTRLDAADDLLYDFPSEQGKLDELHPVPSNFPRVDKADLLEWADQQDKD